MFFRGIKDGAKGPGLNLEQGIPPPDTVEPYTIAVENQQATAGDLNIQIMVNLCNKTRHLYICYPWLAKRLDRIG